MLFRSAYSSFFRLCLKLFLGLNFSKSLLSPVMKDSMVLVLIGGFHLLGNVNLCRLGSSSGGSETDSSKVSHLKLAEGPLCRQ